MQKVITIKAAQELLGNISVGTASRKITLLRDAIGKPKPKIITVTEFKEYYGIE